MKLLVKSIIFLILVSCNNSSLITNYELDRRDVLNGKLSMLIPEDFILVTREDYPPAKRAKIRYNSLYTNSDTTVSISFMEIPKRSNNLDWCKPFTQTAFLMRASKTYFNDTISINGNKMHLAEFESTFSGKKTYMKMFYINLESTTVIGNISCHLVHKEQWISSAVKVFQSIRIN